MGAHEAPQRARGAATSIGWPVVGLAMVLGAFVIAVLWVIPQDDTQSRAAILGILVTTSGAAVAFFTRAKVNQVQGSVAEVDKKVNGRMTQLLDQNALLIEALRAAEAARREGGNSAGSKPE